VSYEEGGVEAEFFEQRPDEVRCDFTASSKVSTTVLAGSPRAGRAGQQRAEISASHHLLKILGEPGVEFFEEVADLFSPLRIQ
jgi:hypothetical protein